LPENLLPIYSQELAVRLAYSQIVNTEFYNYLMDEIKTLATQHGISKYEQTKSEMHNMFFIFGGAGVGKSTGVATIIKKIFANNSNIKVAAPTTKQATKLKNILKVNLY
jgi:signal recognition particle GTPase